MTNADTEKEFVVLEFNDFVKLNSMAKTKSKTNITKLKSIDLLFLADVVQKFSCNSITTEVIFSGNNVTIHNCKNDGTEISSTFDIKICEKYYNQPLKFISEVL